MVGETPKRNDVIFYGEKGNILDLNSVPIEKRYVVVQNRGRDSELNGELKGATGYTKYPIQILKLNTTVGWRQSNGAFPWSGPVGCTVWVQKRNLRP